MLIEEGRLKASIEVYNDLGEKDDELFKWCKEHKDKLVVDIDSATQAHVARIMAAYPRLVDTVSGRFGSDPFHAVGIRVAGVVSARVAPIRKIPIDGAGFGNVRALVGLRQARGPRRLALTARFAARLRSCATTMLGMGEETTCRCKKSSRAPIHCFRLFLSMEKATRACASFKVRNG